MSGHSKWANIKRHKAIVDAQRGQTFSRYSREITVAARAGGGNPEANFRLKTAIEKARSANLPAETTARAIQRGVGASEGGNFAAVTYEGYGPGGVAILLDILTDNRNRTAADIRHLFTRYGGSLGETGCVAWMFERRAVVRVAQQTAPEDRVLAVALELGAEDVESDAEGYTVVAAPDDMENIRAGLQAQGIAVESAEVERVASNTVALAGADAERAWRLIDALQEHDDVQDVYSNLETDEPDV